MYKNEVVPPSTVADELAFSRLSPEVQKLAQRVLLSGGRAGQSGRTIAEDALESAIVTMRESAKRLEPFAQDLTIFNIRKVLCQTATECWRASKT